MKKQTLWTRNYCLLTVGTVLGAAGGVLTEFALSFLVFDETGSTLAAASLIAVQVIPFFLIPLLFSPMMDRLPRKPFLVGGDAVNGILYGIAGLYLLKCPFSYITYLLFSLLVCSISAFDMLAYDSIFPNLIPEGFEQKGYSVSGMIYPILQVVMAPLAAVLFDSVGAAWILIIQSGLSLIAAFIENFIRVEERARSEAKVRFSFAQWKNDIRDAIEYLKGEKGLQSIFAYVAFSSGVGTGYQPLTVAFFRTAPGFTLTMYSLFSVALFTGRALGGLFHYHVKIPEKKRFSFAFFVYQFYDVMDALLLWLPYPFMLLNRAVCGFLGMNSGTMRQTAVQGYIPDSYRARINAFESVLVNVACGLFSLLIGALGEIMDLRLCCSVCGGISVIFSWIVIYGRKKYVCEVYNRPPTVQKT